MSIEWLGFMAYSYPPMKPIPKLFQKVRKSQVLLYLVALHWPNQVWFLEMMQLLFGHRLQLQPWRHLCYKTVCHQNLALLSLQVLEWDLSGVLRVLRSPDF